MLSTGTGIFVQLLTESPQRILHPGTVTEMGGQHVTAQLEGGRCEVRTGQEVFVYFETNREFMKQPARIHASLGDDDETREDAAGTIGFELIGEAVSAENRQAYRVSTVTASLEAEIEGETCVLTDVSYTGFSVIASTHHNIGALVDATLRFEGKAFRGPACVFSAKELNPARVRYGFHCAEKSNETGEILEGLSKINSAVQRDQLRRRSGAA